MVRQRRRSRVLVTALIGLIGLGGSIALSWGINMVSSAVSGKVPLLAWALLICGALACTGGIIPLLYALARDYKAKLTIRVTDARLKMTELEPGVSRWHLEVEVNVIPPSGHLLILQSDRVKVIMTNAYAPLEILNMAIGHNSAAMSAELTIGQQRELLCEGAVILNIAPEIPLNQPQSFPCRITMTDACGEWTATASFELVASNENEWSTERRHQ